MYLFHQMHNLPHLEINATVRSKKRDQICLQIHDRLEVQRGREK